MFAFVGAERDPTAATESLDLDRRSHLGPWFEVRDLGQTPGEVAVPPHLLWWVAPERHIGKALPAILGEVAAQDAAGLDLSNSRVKDADLAPVAKMHALRVLILQSCPQLTPGVGAHLPRGLRFLSLSRCSKMRDEVLPELGRAPELTGLDLSGSPVTRFELLPAVLTQLDVGWIKKLTNASFEPIGKLTHLERLDLSSCPKLTDAALATVLRFRRLQALDLRLCAGLTIKGLLMLKDLPELRWLDVSSLYYGRTGGDGSLRPGDRRALAAALPSVRIDFGVHGRTGGGETP